MEPDLITNTIGIYHQGSGDDQTMWQTSTIDAINYQPDTHPINTGMKPATGVTAVYDPATEDTYLLYVVSTPGETKTATHVLAGSTPGGAMFQGQLYTFFVMDDYTLTYRVGFKSPLITIPHIVAITNPNAVVFTPAGSSQEQLYVFYSGSDNQLWYATTNDGSTWLAKPVASYGPLTPFSDVGVVVYTPPYSTPHLYVFFNFGDHVMFITTPDVVTWTRHPNIPDVELTDGPTVVVLNNQFVTNTLVLLHTAVGGKSAVYFTYSADGDNWSGDFKITSGVNASYKLGAVIEPRSSTLKPKLKEITLSI